MYSVINLKRLKPILFLIVQEQWTVQVLVELYCDLH